MQLSPWRLLAAITMLFGVGVPSAPPAAAMVILGGGAVIVVNGNSYCVLTTIGRDRFGDVVGFTGAQCGGPGSVVALPGTDTPVGTVVAANDGLGYAVIKFDAPDVIPVSDYAGIAISGMGPDPVSDSYVCKWGPTTPGYCNRIRRDGWPDASMIGQFEAGDVGAPVTMDGRLVGLVYGGASAWIGRYLPPLPVTFFTKIGAILGDVNATGGTGSGFVAVGS